MPIHKKTELSAHCSGDEILLSTAEIMAVCDLSGVFPLR
jgi:hypothetical protein